MRSMSNITRASIGLREVGVWSRFLAAAGRAAAELARSRGHGLAAELPPEFGLGSIRTRYVSLGPPKPLVACSMARVESLLVVRKRLHRQKPVVNHDDRIIDIARLAPL